MVDEVFKNLVDQFSDPFTCLRELIQNAMDAGTSSIEVRTRYLDDPGGTSLEVRDFGSGMTREIIDTKLTRLFASDKEDDLTKIGKFGIGFVSVFSLKPELVVVDTGREGEFWRLAFDGGTDFALFTLNEPIEGTSVRLYKIMPFDEHETFCQRARETLARWCRHSSINISFNAEPINCKLEVESAAKIDAKTPLGRFNVGVSQERPCPFGLYNSGLTLMEDSQDAFPGVTYKILSNHLEHTLTRDAVIKDDNYDKVMATLTGLIETDLLRAVGEALRDPKRCEAAAEQSRSYLSWRFRKPKSSDKSLHLFDDVYGNPVSYQKLVDCAKAEDRIFVSNVKSTLSQQATSEGIPILPWTADSAAASLCSLLFQVPVVSLEENLAVSRPSSRPPGFPALESLLKALLREGRITVTSVVPVEYPDSPRRQDSLPCLFALGSERLVRRYRKGFWGTKYLLPQQLLLDVDHPLVRKSLTRLDDPANCRAVAYALCKSALLNDGLSASTENRLLSTLLERS